MSSVTGKSIGGLEYLKQRLMDVINTPLGSLVGRRDFGSRVYEVIDRNVDSSFQMDLYIRLAEAINNPQNGLDDFTLKEMSLVNSSSSNVEIIIIGEAGNDQNVTLNEITISRTVDGRN